MKDFMTDFEGGKGELPESDMDAEQSSDLMRAGLNVMNKFMASKSFRIKTAIALVWIIGTGIYFNITLLIDLIKYIIK